MPPIATKSEPSAAADAADGITNLAAEPLEKILNPVRVEVRRRLKAWHSGRIAYLDENDLVQQVFIALFENDRAVLKRFDPRRGPAVAYLRNFTRKRLIEFERKQLRRDALFAPRLDPKSAASDRTDSPEEWIECFERQDELIRYLRQYASPEDLEIFYLTSVLDLSNPEVAERKNVSAEHVANRKFAIRKHVRACFAKLEQEGGSRK